MNKKPIVNNVVDSEKNNSQYSFKVMTFPIKSFLPMEIARPNEQIQFKLRYKYSKNLTYIIHRAFTTQRYNERQGSANTLTRAEVRGGGRKPWRQKGTGRARAGSNRSPLWCGGGVSFGPKPKSYSNKINRKEWRIALRSLLINKYKNITILDSLEKTCQDNKTKTLKLNFKQFGIDLNEKSVIIIPSTNSSLQKVTQNIKTIKILYANKLNIKELIYAKKLFITKESLKIIEEIYNE